MYNCAFVIAKGAILGAIPKTYMPNYAEFYEYRYFVSGKDVHSQINDPLLGSFLLSPHQLFQMGEMVFAIEICEDLWAPLAPSNYPALAGAQVILIFRQATSLLVKASIEKNWSLSSQKKYWQLTFMYPVALQNHLKTLYLEVIA